MASKALPVTRIFCTPTAPLAKATTSLPTRFMVGLEVTSVGTVLTSARVSCLPTTGPAIKTESVAAGLKCEVG